MVAGVLSARPWPFVIAGVVSVASGSVAEALRTAMNARSFDTAAGCQPPTIGWPRAQFRRQVVTVADTTPEYADFERRVSRWACRVDR